MHTRRMIVSKPMSRSIHHRHYKLLLAHLREIREAAGVTQAALAKTLGHTQGHISKIECGDRRMDALQFVEICEVLGADPVAAFARFVEARATDSADARQHQK